MFFKLSTTPWGSGGITPRIFDPGTR